MTSQFELVPFTAEHALLCRYGGLNATAQAPAWGLAATATLDGARAARLAAATNAAAQLPDPGPVNCPMDDAAHLDAYFWNGSQHIRVRYLTSGCETASNGGAIAFWISRSTIVGQLERLTPGKPLSTLRGTITQFGGPLAADGTPPAPRPIPGIVDLYRRSAGQSTVSGSPVRQIRTAADGTFSFTVASGNYFVAAESLDGTRIVEPQPLTLTPGATATVPLQVDVP